MKYLLKVLALVAVSLLLSKTVFAAKTSDINPADRKHIEAALEKISKVIGKNFVVSEINPTPIPGLFQITSDLNIFYVTRDGKYVIAGDFIDINKDKSIWSITETASRKARQQVLAALNPKDMIIYPAKQPKIGTATVFTDIDCHYCQVLQAKIKTYTDLGIEIRYLAFPRQGPGSKSWDKAVTVWCSNNKTEDYNLAVQGKNLAKNKCANNPVATDFELGIRMGVNGTPTIFLDNGAKIGGIVEAKELSQAIKEQTK